LSQPPQPGAVEGGRHSRAIRATSQIAAWQLSLSQPSNQGCCLMASWHCLVMMLSLSCFYTTFAAARYVGSCRHAFLQP
jgi:hypothetical protein